MLLWYCISHPLIWLWKKLCAFFMRINYRRLGSKLVHSIGNFLHWLIFNVLLPKKHRNITKKEIYRIIFKADTPAGKKFDVWLLVIIGLNLLVIMLDSFEAVHANMRWVIKGLEWIFTIAFTLEYYLRIYCLQRPWKYVLSFYGIIDFLSIFPAYLSLLIPATQTLTVLRVLRTLRIFRIFNMQRFLQEGFHLLNAMRRSLTKILIFMLFVFITAIILGAIIYMFENGKNPAMSSIPTAIYWAVVTITTVGYGDITPVTPIGQFISTLVMLLGYSIIAVPTGIVTGETIREYRQSDEATIPDEFNEYENKKEETEPSEVSADEIKVCPHRYHEENDPAARFCRYCGTLLSKKQPSGWINDFFMGE
jgi:voltage-gated potassium channel